MLLESARERIPTFIPLLFDLELFGQVFVLLPLDFGTDRTVIDKIAGVSHFLLIEIRLVQDLILKVFVGAKMEADLETRFRFVVGYVRETDVNEVLESTRITFGDEVRNANVITQGCEPELWDCGRATGSILCEWRVVRIILERRLNASIELLCRWRR